MSKARKTAAQKAAHILASPEGQEFSSTLDRLQLVYLLACFCEGHLNSISLAEGQAGFRFREEVGDMIANLVKDSVKLTPDGDV